MRLSLQQTVIVIGVLVAACFLGFEKIIGGDAVTGIVTGISGFAIGSKSYAQGVTAGQNGNGNGAPH